MALMGRNTLAFLGVLAFAPLAAPCEPLQADSGRDACVTVDFSRPAGRIRALNGGNLGPQFSNSRRLADGGAAEFGQLGVPSVRLHDVPLFNAGQRLVDVQAVFGNFASDPADPGNYYFKATDDYIRLLRASGSEPFYRLGPSIEHTAETYNAEPPADYAKWAEICCGIIRHCNRGWADGHRWNIRYWEIWNEADIGKPMWNAPFSEYCKLYEVVSKRIKREFPEVKVGGPASVWFNEKPDPRSAGRDCHAFLAWCRDHRCPLDFYTWHHYTKDLKAIADQPAAVRRVLDAYGFPKAELILDEWHYGSGSADCATDATADDETAGVNAAVFCPAVLTRWQDTPITMGHHYTIGPSAWGYGRAWGAWRITDGTSEPRFKLFYTLRMFAGMLRHADRVAASSDTPDVTVLAGRDPQGRRAVLVSNLKSGAKSVRVRLKGAEGVRFRRVRTDAAHDEMRDEVTADAGGEIVLDGAAEGLSACVYLYESDDDAVEREGIVPLKKGYAAVVSDHPEKRFEKSWSLAHPVSNGILRVSADIRVPLRWGRKSASHWKGYPLRESALRIGLGGRLGEAGPTFTGNGNIRSVALEAGEDEGVAIAEARTLGDCVRGDWYRHVLEFDLERGTYSASAVRRDDGSAAGSVRGIRFAMPLGRGQSVTRVVATAQGVLSGIGDAFVPDDAGGFDNVCVEWRAPGGATFGSVPVGAGGTDADIQRLVDGSVGKRAVLPPGDYEISRTIRIPSHTHLFFGNCRLRMRDGAIAPMFRNRLDADGLSRDIVLDGGGSGVLDGGLPNGLDEHTSRKNGLPHVSENLTLYFTQLDGFEVRNFTVRDQRWWALMFLQCTKGRIAGVHFELTRHALDSRRPWRNQDGIDLRVGCSDIVIEDITGETGDDLIALTALNSPYFEQRHARADRPRGIRDVTIRRVKGRTNQCALIRLLSHFGQKIERIRIFDVTEDSVPGRHNQTQMAIRIGDRFEWYYGRDERNAQRFGDICDVTVDGLVTRALTAVVTDDSIDRLTVRNVRLVADAGSAWCCGPWNIDIAPFIYVPEREKEVQASRLVPNVATEWRAPRRDIVRARDVLFENVACENVPHHGEAAFRFCRSRCENCVIRNVRLPADRRKVELLETEEGPRLDD